MTNHEDAAPFLWATEGKKRQEEAGQPSLENFRFPVDITAGSRQCTLGVLWKHTVQRFRIRVYAPDGDALGTRPGVRWVQGDYPYAFCVIDKPKDGTWHVEVFGADVREAKFRTIGFEVNDRIRFEVWPIETHIRFGTDIQLRARLLAPVAVPGLDITAWVRHPDGVWERFQFKEFPTGMEDREKSFVWTASIPTRRKLKGQYLIAVDAYRENGIFEAKPDPFYTRRPEASPKDLIQQVAVPRIRRRVFLTVAADARGRSSEEPLAGYGTKPPQIPDNHEKLLEGWRASHSRSRE